MKELYVKYSLIVLILVLGIVIFSESLPFLGGVLGAFTIYILVRGQMIYLTETKKMKPSLVATLLLLEVILCVLVPISLITWFLIEQTHSINLNIADIIVPIQRIVDFIREKTGYNVMQVDNLTSVASLIPKIGQSLMGGISSFAINIFALLFLLYFMLLSGRKMEKYLYDLLPFHLVDKKIVTLEIHQMVRSNAIIIPLLAIIQGTIALVGYYIFGAPNPILMGILTSFATIIPIVGTGLIWLPLVVYFAIIGHWGSAIGLLLYALLIISNTDNLARLMLQKKIADIHPLITIFGVVIGLSLFGFIGVIFGPLLISMFMLCLNIFKNQYLTGDDA